MIVGAVRGPGVGFAMARPPAGSRHHSYDREVIGAPVRSTAAHEEVPSRAAHSSDFVQGTRDAFMATSRRVCFVVSQGIGIHMDQGNCPRCRTEIQSSALFCPRCGDALTVEPLTTMDQPARTATFPNGLPHVRRATPRPVSPAFISGVVAVSALLLAVLSFVLGFWLVGIMLIVVALVAGLGCDEYIVAGRSGPVAGRSEPNSSEHRKCKHTVDGMGSYCPSLDTELVRGGHSRTECRVEKVQISPPA